MSERVSITGINKNNEIYHNYYGILKQWIYLPSSNLYGEKEGLYAIVTTEGGFCYVEAMQRVRYLDNEFEYLEKGTLL